MIAAAVLDGLLHHSHTLVVHGESYRLRLRLYVNGVLEATATAPSSRQASGTFHIGRAISGSQFVGALDEVRVYATALCDADVSAVFRGP